MLSAPDVLAFLDAWLPAPPARVLEIGCGDGALTERLAGRGYRTTGIDPDPPAGGRFARRPRSRPGELHAAGARLVLERV